MIQASTFSLDKLDVDIREKPNAVWQVFSAKGVPPPLGGKYFCLRNGGIVGYLFPINKKNRLTVFDLFPNPLAINTPAFKMI